MATADLAPAALRNPKKKASESETGGAVSTHQGKAVDLHVDDLHLPVGHARRLAFVLFVGLQVGAEPLQLKGPGGVVAVIHFVQAWGGGI